MPNILTCWTAPEPILAYNAEGEINALHWSCSQADWIAIAFDSRLQILRVWSILVKQLICDLKRTLISSIYGEKTCTVTSNVCGFCPIRKLIVLMMFVFLSKSMLGDRIDIQECNWKDERSIVFASNFLPELGRVQMDRINPIYSSFVAHVSYWVWVCILDDSATTKAIASWRQVSSASSEATPATVMIDSEPVRFTFHPQLSFFVIIGKIVLNNAKRKQRKRMKRSEHTGPPYYGFRMISNAPHKI